MSNIDKIDKLIAQIAEELETYGDENAADQYDCKFNEAQAKLGSVIDAFDDFKDAFDTLTDAAVDEEYCPLADWDDNYNGVSQEDYLETFYI